MLEKEVQPAIKEIALDRLAAVLEVAAADRLAAAVPVKNDPPKILFSTRPAILVLVDGAPVYQPVKETKLERVINTRVLLLRQKNEHFVKVFDGWLGGRSARGTLDGPKKESRRAQEGARGRQGLGPGGLPAGREPERREDAALAQVGEGAGDLRGHDAERAHRHRGRAAVRPDPGHRARSTSRTRRATCSGSTADQKLYLLLSGRWFRSASSDGPWEHVASDALPKDFAKIPDDSEKENVKAAVAGTPQAKEALIANAIPQTAEVKVKETKIDPPKFDGEVKLAPIEGTSLQYVVNTATPIIRVSATSWYAVQDAVWFTAAVGGRPVVGRDVRAARDLHDPAELAAALRDLRARSTRPSADDGLRRLHARLLRHAASRTAPSSTAPATTTRPTSARRGTDRPSPTASGVGMTYTPWTGWTYGFGFGWSWGAVTVGWGWGAYPWWGPVGWGYYYPYPYYRPPYWGGGGVGAVGRRRRLGTRRLGGDDGQRLSPLGRDLGRHARLGRLQRLDGRRLAELGRACRTTRAPGTSRPASARRSATSTPATTPTAAAAAARQHAAAAAR